MSALAAACAEAVALALLARRGQWDFAWFHEQVAGDPALESFCATLGASGLLHGRTRELAMPLSAPSRELADAAGDESQKFRKNLKAARRKLEAAGKLEYEAATGTSAACRASC